MRTVALFILLALTSCTSLETLDRSRVNHPAMDLAQDRTLPQASYLADLNVNAGPSSGGSCSVCAH